MVPVLVGIKRSFGTTATSLTYLAGSLLSSRELTKEVEVENYSLYGVPVSTLPWEMMRLAVPFIAACLNSRCKGTIGFGVSGRGEEATATVGQVIGVVGEKNMMPLIYTSFMNLLNHHIETEKFSKLDKVQKESIMIYPIRVTYPSDGLDLHDRSSYHNDAYVFEIDIDPQWETLGNHFYYYWWFSQFHADLRGPEAYRVYQHKSLIERDRENKVLVERRDGETWTQPHTHGAILLEVVRRKYQRHRERVEEKRDAQASSGL